MAPDAATTKTLSELRVQRGTIQGQQTKLKKTIETSGNNLCSAELQTRLGLLETYYINFSAVQTKLECMDEEEQIGDKREAFEETYCLVKTKILNLMSTKKIRGSLPTIQSDINSSNVIRSVRLPKLELSKFSGKYSDWTDFISMFTTLVDEDETLNKVEKFQHLRSCLSDNALQIIQALEMTPDNYDTALSLLKKRFDNKRLIFQAHIKEIFKLPSLTRGSVTDLRKLSDSANVHMRALLRLGNMEQIADGLLMHIVTQKFDAQTQIKWEEDAQPNVIPAWDELTEFINKRCQMLEHVAQAQQFNSDGYKSASNTNSNKRLNNSFQKISLLTSKNKSLCVMCKVESHNIPSCPNFITLTAAARYQEAKRLNLCINCLRKGHNVKTCKSGRCRHCSSKHHSLLHMSTTESIQQPSQYSGNNSDAALGNNSNTSNYNQSLEALPANTCHLVEKPENSSDLPHVFLATALVLVKNSNGSYTNCRALLDSASQLNFVTERFCQQLRLKKSRSNININGIGISNTCVKFKTDIVIKSRLNNFAANIKVLVLPTITASQPDRFIDIAHWNIPPNIKLADPYFNLSQRVDLLIGAELFFDLLSVGQIKLEGNLPSLQKTVLGWIVSGSLGKKSHPLSCFTAIQSKDYDTEVSCDKLLESFWKIENHYSPKAMLSPEEMECEAHFLHHYNRLATGRYSVRLPFRECPTVLGDSLEVAKRRFFRLEHKISKDPAVKIQYNAFMKEYLDLGHMKQINYNELCASNHYFLPHHCVLKPQSSSTSLRVVFDGSCKTTSGRSLNDILMVGPVVQDDLFSILLRFRTYRYAMTADVTKMYRQVEVQDPDNLLQCILWRDAITDPLLAYRLVTVTYGTSSASFLATRSLIQLAQDEKSDYPLGSIVAQRDFYVDDLLTGANTVSDTLRLRAEVDSLLRKGGFLLRKWCANNESILRGIKESDREKHIIIESDAAIKTLGLIWHPDHDEFRFFLSDFKHFKAITKRTVLSIIASLFDPLGLINPIIVRAKVFMQQLWRLNLHWDETLPIELHTWWKDFTSQLVKVKSITIPRHVVDHNYRYELHGFADASSIAYGACIYLKSIDYNGEASVKLLCSKSRVAPLKTISIPRLELCAALLLSELMKRIQSSLLLAIVELFCWSDSAIVLAWLSSSPCKWNVFVANRVSQIQELTDSYNWKYVPTLHNPADIISRGTLPNELSNSKLWFNGPTFLLEEQSLWPTLPCHSNEEQVPEKRRTAFSLITTKCEDLITSSKFCNSFLKLQRVFGYIHRFYKSARRKDRLHGSLKSSELEEALIWLVKIVQKLEFASEISSLRKDGNLAPSSSIKSLNPFIDKEGIMRVGGRIQNSSASFDEQHPILLPKSHSFTKALMTYYHQKHLHCGYQTLLAIVRTKFWPISGRMIAREVQHRCVRCFRSRPRNIEQIMGILPAERVNPSRPFTYTGTDFFGPLFITSLVRGRAPTKAYGCIFICFSTKAVHIELVTSLTTEAFLCALKRFIARRGRPSTIFSDNATNFTGASKELKDLQRLLYSDHHNEVLQNSCAEENIKWKFIPPRSPHFGGLWEASVKSAKVHIRRVVGMSVLTQEELNTLLTQIEAAINSRPITPISSDPNDFAALTPGHFLIGAPLLAIPEPNISDMNITRLSRWKRVTKMNQDFWLRWSRDYLQHLQQRSKWSQSNPNILINSLVLLKEDNTSPLRWPLGRIIQLHPGDDGIVRVVSVKTIRGIFKRATTRICPLPVEAVGDDSSLAADSPKAGGNVSL